MFSPKKKDWGGGTFGQGGFYFGPISLWFLFLSFLEKRGIGPKGFCFALPFREKAIFSLFLKKNLFLKKKKGMK